MQHNYGKTSRYTHGYLLLAKSNRFFEWIKKAQNLEFHSRSGINEMNHMAKNKKLKVITQIAVAHSFLKHGMGRQLVDYAKTLTPILLTSIMHKPIINRASLTFFSKQGFHHIATIYTEGTAPKFDPHEIYIEFWKNK